MAQPDVDMQDLLKDIFVSNELSAKRVHRLARSAWRGGIAGCKALAKAGKDGQHHKNLARDLMRLTFKSTDFPCGVHLAQIPVKNRRTKLVENKSMPFLLPHEAFDAFSRAQGRAMNRFSPQPEGPFAAIYAKMSKFSEEFGVPMDRLVPIGVHADGVPFKAKMRDSLDQISWNLCGVDSPVRFLFGSLPSSAIAGRQTWDAIWDVFAWSMRSLLIGSWPSARHDRSPWMPNDARRSRRAGDKFHRIACCVQARGDWAFPEALWILF